MLAPEPLTASETLDDWVMVRRPLPPQARPSAHTPEQVDLTVSSHNVLASRGPKTTVVQAGHGYAFAVSAGDRFRIVDLHGTQVVDFMAFVRRGSSLTKEKLSMAYTRYHLSGAPAAVGEHLYTNADSPIFRIAQDTVKVHDMTFMSCNPDFYRKMGYPKDHRSCSQNITEAMEGWGLEELDIRGTDPLNLFQNTPLYTIKALGSSKPGDYVEMEALMDCVVAISCCPYEGNGFNGGKVTDVAVVTGVKG